MNPDTCSQPKADLSSFHISNLGRFGGSLVADQEGYVHLTAENVRAAAIRLDECGEDDPADLIDWEECESLAQANRAALAEADRALAAWQSGPER